MLLTLHHPNSRARAKWGRGAAQVERAGGVQHPRGQIWDSWGGSTITSTFDMIGETKTTSRGPDPCVEYAIHCSADRVNSIIGSESMSVDID